MSNLDDDEDDDDWNPVEQTGAADEAPTPQERADVGDSTNASREKATDVQEIRLDAEALEALEKALDNADKQKAKGTLLFQKGQYDEACEAYREGAEAVEMCLTPEAMSAEIRRLLVALYCNASQASLKCSDAEARTNGACTMAEKALVLEPSNVKALFRRGCAYGNASDWDMAWDDLNRALALDPGNEAIMRELEKISAKCGKRIVAPQVNTTSQSEGPLDKAIAIATKKKETGTSQFKHGDFYTAFENFRVGAETLDSFSLHTLTQAARKLKADLYNNAAVALLQCSHIEGATSTLACEMACKVLEVDPGNVKALFRRGCAYHNGNEYLNACSDFEKVLLLDPANKDARRELTKIENLLPFVRDRGHVVSDFISKGAEKTGCKLDTLDAPGDPAEVCKAVLRRLEQLREDIFEAAKEKSCQDVWCQRLNKIQSQSLEWARHQLADAEMHDDLVLMYGPFFADLDLQQKEDFVMGYEFEKELQTVYSKELEGLFSSSDGA